MAARFGRTYFSPWGMTTTWLPTVNVAKRAVTKASPRFFAVTVPSGETVALLSLLLWNTTSEVTSRSVLSE